MKGIRVAPGTFCACAIVSGFCYPKGDKEYSQYKKGLLASLFCRLCKGCIKFLSGFNKTENEEGLIVLFWITLSEKLDFSRPERAQKTFSFADREKSQAVHIHQFSCLVGARFTLILKT